MLSDICEPNEAAVRLAYLLRIPEAYDSILGSETSYPD
jgi:hypothetical protein